MAIRDKNKRSDWDEWLAVSLAGVPNTCARAGLFVKFVRGQMFGLGCGSGSSLLNSSCNASSTISADSSLSTVAGSPFTLSALPFISA